MIAHRRTRIAAAAAVSLAVAPAALAQADEVTGTVRDALGRPLAAASVQLERADGGIVASVATDREGHYAFPGVAAGTYAVVASESGYQTGTAVVTAGTGAGRTDLTLAAAQALDLAVIARRLDQARNNLSPETGSSTYTIDDQAVQDVPTGDATAFDKVLLQAPGIAQDSAASGQMHVRGEHADVQYRINGVLLPEGISGFGTVLDSGIIDSMNVIDGTLPAQYGYRTAAIVDIQTRDGAFTPGTSGDLTLGSHATIAPEIDTAGSVGALSYFASGSAYRSDYGIEGPTSAADPLHDATDQGKGFGYASYLLNPSTRLNLVLGSAVSRFQVPDNPGQPVSYTVTGAPIVDSSRLDETQLEETDFATLALQGTSGAFDYQVAPYARYTLLHFTPDAVGDLEYNGVASNVQRTDLATGLQADGGWRLDDRHTLRAGFMAQGETAVADNTSSVFSLDPASPIYCNPAATPGTACTPFSLTDDHSKLGTLYGVYLQDEWKPLPRLTVNYGARFDQVNAYVSGNQVSPRLGTIYQVTDAIALHAGYARYFTPPPMELVQPSSVALFANTTQQPSVTEDDPVKPERTNSFDLGVIDQLDAHVQLGLDSYYKLATDLLDEGQFGSALVLTPFNYAKGRIYGTEFTASYSGGPVTGYFNFAASRAMGESVVSSQESFSDDPAELAGTQGHWIFLDHDQTYSATAGLAWQVVADTKVTIDDTMGSGLRDGFDNFGHLPTYNQVDLGVIQHLHVFDPRGADLRLAVVNLLDDAYELRDGSGIGVGAPQWGPRRAVYATLHKEF